MYVHVCGMWCVCAHVWYVVCMCTCVVCGVYVHVCGMWCVCARVWYVVCVCVCVCVNVVMQRYKCMHDCMYSSSTDNVTKFGASSILDKGTIVPAIWHCNFFFQAKFRCNFHTDTYHTINKQIPSIVY